MPNRRRTTSGEALGPGPTEQSGRPHQGWCGAPETEEPGPGAEGCDARECHDLLKRVRADFVNYKRRVEREREEQAKCANKGLILKLLPVLDDFDQALRHVPADIADNDWVRGVTCIERKLMAILEGEGVSRIRAEGEAFDPWEHEAVMCEQGCDDEEGKVKAVLRRGYRLHDRVIRPAQVAVCEKPYEADRE